MTEQVLVTLVGYDTARVPQLDNDLKDDKKL